MFLYPKLTSYTTDYCITNNYTLESGMQLKETCQRPSGVLPLIEYLNQISERRSILSPFLSGPDGEPIKKNNKNYTLLRFLVSEISCRVKEVFGNPDFSKAVRGDDKLDDESGDEDSSEEISESGKGEDKTGFDEDFCINFSKINPFASL
jgi:hypothetical protein